MAEKADTWEEGKLEGETWTAGHTGLGPRSAANQRMNLAATSPPRSVGSVGFLIRKDSRWGKITFDKLRETLLRLSSGGSFFLPSFPSSHTSPFVRTLARGQQASLGEASDPRPALDNSRTRYSPYVFGERVLRVSSHIGT